MWFCNMPGLRFCSINTCYFPGGIIKDQNYSIHILSYHMNMKPIGMNEGCCKLTWKLVGQNIRTNLKTEFTNNDLTDVTLVSDDLKPIQAHRFILGACSLVLKELLLKNPHPDPIIYLKGVDYEELKYILHFVYLGEVKVPKDSIKKFLDIGQELQIEKINENQVEFSKNREDFEKRTTDAIEDDVIKYNHEENEHTSLNPFACNSIEKIVDFSKRFNTNAKEEQRKFSSLERSSNQRTETEDASRYFCDSCHYEASKQSHLKTHQQSIHEGIRYSCDTCNYKATTTRTLKRHQESVHYGIRHYCNECNQYFTQQSSLRSHQRNKHEGFRYECGQCEYKAGQRGHLKAHKIAKHSKTQSY